MSPTDKQLAELLAEISKKLKDIVASIDRYLEAVKPVEIKIKELKKLFSEDLRKQLIFEETDQYFIIRPKGYLGTENFGKIASIVRDELRGEYISAGKESHFRIKKREINRDR